jgi:hypothetical protein
MRDMVVVIMVLVICFGTAGCSTGRLVMEMPATESTPATKNSWTFSRWFTEQDTDARVTTPEGVTFELKKSSSVQGDAIRAAVEGAVAAGIGTAIPVPAE